MRKDKRGPTVISTHADGDHYNIHKQRIIFATHKTIKNTLGPTIHPGIGTVNLDKVVNIVFSKTVRPQTIDQTQQAPTRLQYTVSKDTVKQARQAPTRLQFVVAPPGSGGQAASPPPPSWATFMMYCFLGKSDRETIAGDLEEEFTTDVLPKLGPGRARVWFWTQAIGAIARQNPLCRWLLIGVGEWIARKLGG